jgi:two-component system NtrC family response regulator
MRKSLEISFKEFKEYEIKTFKNAKEALKNLDDSYELIITDINMPGMDGMEFIKEVDGKFEVIVITGNATLSRAIESIRLGVKDFLTKPFEIDTLLSAIKRSKKAIEFKKIHKVVSENNDEFFSIVSSALEKPLNMAKRAAKTDASVLLLGESGVGKEVFAKYIHQNSTRSAKPFIAINMGAIPETLIESELFGYEKGAFTDAQKAKPGKFEEANGGTLFLDEIGDMPYHLQVKLLRALQEKEITRLGSTKSIKIDIRLISATNSDIENSIKDGNFREDLYYRINTIPIKIPPLRERKEEILPIAQNVLKDASIKYGLEEKSFSKDAQEVLLRYSWPGNIRELISACERATILSEDKIISKDDLFLEEREGKKSLEEMEKELLREIFEECNKDVEESAKMYGTTQKEFERKLKKYNIF